MKTVLKGTATAGLLAAGHLTFHTQLPSSTAYADYIDPKSGVRYKDTVTVMRNPQGRELVEEELEFVHAGVRCMLGNSVLCDQVPETRVFSFGLYTNRVTDAPPVDVTETYLQKRARSKVLKKGRDLSEAPSFSKHVLRTDDHKEARCLRVVSCVPKHGLHWARGYHKVLDKRLKQEMSEMRNTDRTFKKERMATAQEALRKFCEVFAWEGMIPAGTEFLFTWSDGAIVVQMDGRVIKVLHNEDVARALFLTYLGIRSVNRDVSVVIRKQWQRRELYPDWIPLDNTDVIDPDYEMGGVRRPTPDCDRCSLHGFQLHGEYKETDYSIITTGIGGSVGLPGKKQNTGAAAGGHI